MTDAADDARPGYLAIDLGPSRLTAGVVDTAGEVVLRDRVATPPRNVWPALTQLVRRVLAANPTEVAPIAVGLTCPGPIDHGTGSMKPVGKPMWHDFPLRRELSAITQLPVYLDTAGRGLARAELWRGEFATVDRVDQDFATLSVGDEVDGALVSGGVVLEGLTDNLGQFGHLIVEPDGAECVCGAAGCLSAYASVRAIEASTGRELRRTPPARINNVGIMIARACASLAAMFDVAEIIVGGVVPEVLGPPLFDALAKEFEVRSSLPHLASVRVRGVGSRQIGPLVGAAAIALAHHRPDAPAPD
ncbi:MAG: ROK family protein [Ilumatobacter sp.]|nr:ROK family protein [Ilumatobacter sp.]